MTSTKLNTSAQTDITSNCSEYIAIQQICIHTFALSMLTNIHARNLTDNQKHVFHNITTKNIVL